jgi:uncharacterized membrane protein
VSPGEDRRDPARSPGRRASDRDRSAGLRGPNAGGGLRGPNAGGGLRGPNAGTGRGGPTRPRGTPYGSGRLGARPVAGRGHRLRRRVDALALRVQGRFDTDWSDRVLPWLCAGGLFVVLLLLASARARSFESTIDQAASIQAVWLIHHGLPATVTVTTGQHALAPQVSAVLFPISLLAYLPVPIGVSLLVLQAGALSLAVVPIWRLCRKLANLRVGTSMCVITAYALFPAVHSLNLAGFHPETLALPALLYAAYYGLSSRWRRFGVCCVFVLLCRADLGLAVAGLGGLVWASGRKVEGRVAVGVGLAYTALAVLILEPRLAGGVFPHAGAHAAFGDTPATVAWGMLAHPTEVVGALLREENFDLTARLLAPVLFLPLLAPRYLLPVLPLEFLYLTSAASGSVVYGEQTVAVTAFVFLATAFALKGMGRPGTDRVRIDRWVLVVLLVAVGLSFGRDGAASPYRHPWGWGGRDQTDQARVEAIALVGETRSVRASATLLPELAERTSLYQFVITARPDPAAAATGVSAVILDRTTVPEWTAFDQAAFRVGLESRGFRRASEDDGIEVYLRD